MEEQEARACCGEHISSQVTDIMMSPISFPDNCSLNYLFINYQLYIRLTGRFFVHKIKPDRSDTTLNTLTGKENYKTGSEVGLFCVDCPFIKQL